PQSRITAPARALLKMVPATTSEAVLNNSSRQADPSYNRFYDYTVKGDHYFNASHHFSGTVVSSENPAGGGSLLPGALQTAGDTTRSWTNARATHDWVIRPNLLNELKLGYNREIFTNYPTGSYAPGWQEQLGIPGFQDASALFPGIIWGSYRTMGNKQFWYATSNTYVLNDSIAWTRANHNFKFGFEHASLWHALYKDWPVQMTFARTETGLPSSLGATGNEAASLLLGLVDNSNIPLLKSSVDYQWRTIDAYAQDDYKVTSRLTINYGVRWSMFIPMQERDNIYSAVDLNKPNPSAGNLAGSYVFAGVDGQGKRLSPVKDSVNRFAPRIGFAWKMSEKIVIRSGYGMSFFPTGAFGSGNNVFLTDGYDPTSLVATPDNGLTPGFSFATGFPQDKILKRSLTPAYSIGSNFNYWSNYASQVAQMHSWNFSTQFQLRPNLALEVAYVGTKGTHLSSLENINQLNPSYLGLGNTLLNSNINSPAVVAAGYKPPWPGFATALGANATLAQSLRPYPQYLSGFGYNSDNDGNSSYHALQTKLERRMSNGLYLLAAFTWSKSITDANTTLYSVPGNNPTGSGRVRDQYNRHLDKAVASAWQPAVLTSAINYELPFGPGKMLLNSGGLVGRLAGGWRVGGI
ncbi:MAG: TonB-dependent receptor, partial [Bryobacteraceae bacterium]